MIPSDAASVLAVGDIRRSVGESVLAFVPDEQSSPCALEDTFRVGGMLPTGDSYSLQRLRVLGGPDSRIGSHGRGDLCVRRLLGVVGSLSPMTDGVHSGERRVRHSSCRTRVCSVRLSKANTPLADRCGPLTKIDSLVRSDKWAAWPDCTIRGVA